MRIGVHVLAEDLTPREVIDRLHGIAGRGFAHGWVNQGARGWDPLGLLAATGPIGDRGFELGTAIVPTFSRHPVIMADAALTAQALTGGRLTLGIGPSHAAIVQEQQGIPYRAPAQHTREYLEILRPLLRGEAVDYRGERLSTVSGPLAVDAPPRVLLSALGPAMLRIAGELTDGTLATWVRPGLVADYLVPRINAAAPSGARPRVLAGVLTAVTDDPDRLRAEIATNFAVAPRLPAYRAVLDRGGLDNLGDAAVLGAEEDVVKELRRFRDAGATDYLALVMGTPQERRRTFDVLAELSTSNW